MNEAIFASFIAKDVDNGIIQGVFPDDLKHAGVTPVHKKRQRDKINYRPANLLPIF